MLFTWGRKLIPWVTSIRVCKGNKALIYFCSNRMYGMINQGLKSSHFQSSIFWKSLKMNQLSGFVCVCVLHESLVVYCLSTQEEERKPWIPCPAGLPQVQWHGQKCVWQHERPQQTGDHPEGRRLHHCTALWLNLLSVSDHQTGLCPVDRETNNHKSICCYCKSCNEIRLNI